MKLKSILLTIVTTIGLTIGAMAQTQLNSITNFTDFPDTSSSNLVNYNSSPHVGFNISGSAGASEYGRLKKEIYV